MNRQQIDRQMSLKLINKVLSPLADDLGAKYLVPPALMNYDHENKSIKWRFGYDGHGDKRRHTDATLDGTFIRDGELIEGKVQTIERDARIGWTRKHDNRLVQNREVVDVSLMLYEEKFNKLRSLTSLDVLSELTVAAQGEIAGIGGSVSQHTSVSAHTEIETEKFNHTKKEQVIKDTVTIEYPGPVLYEANVLADDGAILHRQGDVEHPGDVWLIERPIMSIQTIQPVTQWGIWDVGKIRLNLYDWAGNRGIMPSGRHWNVLEFNGLNELLDFMRRELVLQYPWSSKYRPSDKAEAGMKWLAKESNRHVGPVEWDRVTLNDNTGALEPSIITP